MDPIRMLQEKLERTVEFGTRTLDTLEPLEVERLDQKLRTLDSLCRETFQDTLRDAYDVIAGKLEKGEPLDANERHALELLFTGEAKHYLKTENNFHDWIAELQRLIGLLGEVGRGGVANLADLMHMQALCRDAMHVMPEVLYYLREQERIELFRESLHGEINREEGRVLARMIRDLMASPSR
jgi:hypothetical protein